MTKRWTLPLAACIIASTAMAQTDSPKLADPVTEAEAMGVILKVEDVMGKVLGVKAPPRSLRPWSKTKAMSRAAIIDEFDRLFALAKPQFKYTQDPQTFDKAQLKAPAPQLAKLEKLIAFGLVAPVGPLATGPGDTLKLREFGDAIGYLISSVASLTHTPSSRWSPYLVAMDQQIAPSRRELESKRKGGGGGNRQN